MTYLEWKRHVSIFRFIRGENTFEAIPEEMDMLIYCRYKAAMSETIPLTVTLIVAEEMFTVKNVVDSLTLAVAAKLTGDVSSKATPADSITLSVTPESGVIKMVCPDDVADALVSGISPRTGAVLETSAEAVESPCKVVTYSGAVGNELCAVAAVVKTGYASGQFGSGAASGAVMFATQITAIHAMTLAANMDALGSKINLGVQVKIEASSPTEYYAMLAETLQSRISAEFEKVGATELAPEADDRIDGIIAVSTETVLIDELLSRIQTDLSGRISVDTDAELTDYATPELKTETGDGLSVEIEGNFIDGLVESINADFVGQVTAAPELLSSDGFNIATEPPEVKVTAAPELLSATEVKAESGADVSVSAELANLAKASVDDYTGRSVDGLSGASVEDAAYIEV